MSDLTRRKWLAAAAAAYVSGTLDLEAAQHVHETVSTSKTGAPYRPRFFQPHQYQALQILAGLIIPADSDSKGALDAGAPEFIDLLCSQNDDLASIYNGGLAWLEAECRRRFGSGFSAATGDQRVELLTLIAYRKNDSPSLGPGIRFFEWARKMVVDAYYTHPVGIAQVGYVGNSGMTTFEIPAQAIQYAIMRSPFRE